MHKLTHAIAIMFLVLALVVLAPAKPARAASSWSVCGSGCNFTSIAAAIASGSVVSGDTINVHAGTYHEHDVFVSKNLTIHGAGSGLVTVDGDQLGRVFQIANSMTVSISGMTITHGQITAPSGVGLYGAGIENAAGTLTMNDVILTNNAALGTTGSYTFGGGIANEGTLTMTNSQIVNNSSYTNAGGLESYFGSTTHLSHVLVQGNSTTATNGGAGGIQVNSDTGNSLATITLDYVTINNNTSSGSIGGMFVQNYGNATFTNSAITNNTASAGAIGGLEMAIHTTLSMSGTTISGNTGGSYDGGGLYVGSNASAQVDNVTISGNSANNGAGLENLGTLNLTNSTISGNTVSSNGGGIYNYGTLTLLNDTIAANSAASTGGGIYNNGTLNVTNTIVAGSPSGGDCYNAATLGTNTNNLIQDDTCSPALSGDPMLGALANNSGPTLTMAIQPGSPAIDAGDNSSCPATDQRGTPRPQDGNSDSTATCDIGAYEYRLQAVSLSSGALSFGNQLVGTSGAIKSVTLRNVGDHVLALTSITTSPPYAVLAAGACPLGAGTLAAHASCAIRVKFSPVTVGSFSRAVTIKSDAASSPNTIALSGSGIAGTQLLKNPSFETDANLDKKPDNWAFTNFNGATDGRDCAFHQSGSCSLKLVGNGASKVASQTVWKSGGAGNDFTFALWSKAANVPVGSVYRLQVQFYNGTMLLLPTKTLNFVAGTHAFQKVSGSFTASTAYTRVVFSITFKATTGTAWFDTASVNWAP